MIIYCLLVITACISLSLFSGERDYLTLPYFRGERKQFGHISNALCKFKPRPRMLTQYFVIRNLLNFAATHAQWTK